jgi:hypothetical protein
MTDTDRDIWARRRLFFSLRHRALSFLLCSCVAGLFAAAGPPAAAAVRTDLFQATAPLADRSDGALTAAFQTALKTVLVKVTGRRAAATDPALASLIGEARRYVQQYHPAPDGQISVGFDANAIERWLAQAGQPIWGRERPVTFVWLGVQSGTQAGSIVTRDETSELKSALDAEASARGIQLLWPTAADLQSNHVDFAALTTSPGTSLAEIAHRLGGEGVLVGHASTATAAASVRWTELFQDQSREFSGTLEGVDRAADLYASLFAASGSFAPVEIEVDGVNDVKDYAGVESYLESLAFISHVGVDALSGDTVRFHLTTRGGIEPLQRALALNGLLEPIAAGDGGLQRFQLRR